MNDKLNQPFIEVKVECALFQMGPRKALGPDGYGVCFFQDHWSIMREKVCQIVLYFLNSRHSLAEINFTHIVLIPKKFNPRLLTNYRPISLCNVLYKMVAKVLANRLKCILPSLISPTQSAFVLGRLISDNILTAYETLHTMNCKMYGKRGYMALNWTLAKFMTVWNGCFSKQC